MLAKAVVEVGVAALLATWLVLTALNQLGAGGRWRWFARITASALIPSWRFFAPKPGTSDFHLLYRDLLINGVTTGWVEVCPMAPRPALAALWNPRKRPNKAVFDLGVMLLQTAGREDDTRTMLSTPYLAIINHINRLPASSLVACRQFVLMATLPDRPRSQAEPMFVSGFHEL